MSDSVALSSERAERADSRRRGRPRDRVPAEAFTAAVADQAGERYRAFKYNPDLNCVLIQDGLTVMVIPAFAQPDGTVFIDKTLGFRALRQALGREKFEIIKEVLGK